MDFDYYQRNEALFISGMQILNEMNKNQTSTQKSTSINLFNESSSVNILKYLPRTFTLTTNNGSGLFNLDFLRCTSMIIDEFSFESPNNFSYHISIDDDRNVLKKFELLYQGEKVFFEKEDLKASKEIARILEIKCFPNYLMPKSFKNPYSNFRGELEDGIQVNPFGFFEFMKEKMDKNFTISTKKCEYEVNYYGVFYSDIIRNHLIQDETLNRFEYEIGDEFDEFQLIISLFNFETIELTKNNVDFLKETAEKLQITTIIDKINEAIDEFEKVSQVIDEQQSLTDSIEELFDWLFNIEKFKIEYVKDLIVDSFWSKDVENVRELAAFIIHVIKMNVSLHSSIAELLVLLHKEVDETNCLKYLNPIIISKLMPIFNKRISYCSFVFNLYKKNIIPKVSLIDKLRNFVRKDVANNESIRNLISWFLPELIENKIFSHKTLIMNFESSKKNKFKNQKRTMIKFIEKKDDEWTSFIEYYYPNKMDQYKIMRDKGEPDDEITKSIINDDVDTLQSIICTQKSALNFSKNSIPFNIFSENKAAREKFSYINYAAKFGSIKCFKYLLLNHAAVDLNTFNYAVDGGNIEIIKIVDQNKVNKIDMISRYDNQNNKAIIQSIKKHKNDLFDWILENKYSKKIEQNYIASELIVASAEYGNAHSFIEIVNKGFKFTYNQYLKIIVKAASNGFYRLFQIIYNLGNEELIKQIVINASKKEHPFVASGNLSIFKLSLNFTNTTNNLEQSLIFAAKKKYKSIIEYFFSDLIDKKFNISKDGIFETLNNSFTKRSNEMFNKILDEFIHRSPTALFLSLYKLRSILEKACQYLDFEAVKKLTKIILENNKDVEFTKQFLKAASSGSIQICQYFVDQKVCIDYDKLASNSLELGSTKVEIFSMMTENSTLEVKDIFLNTFLESAIEKNNKSLVDFLLKNGSSIGNGLFLAVERNYLDIVNIILNYYNKPSFINKKSNNGTVLHVAINKMNLQIVKTLLKVPGIDPNIYDKNGKSALVLAVSQKSIEIINEILDFYGDDISSHKRMIDEVSKEMLKLIYKDMQPKDSKQLLVKTDKVEIKRNKKLTQILKRILQIKGIDPNCCESEYTFLYYACEINEIEIVNMLLKMENIDVNAYSPKNGNTPLMISIIKQNVDIAKLLIEDERTNINTINYKDKTPLVIAVTKQLTQIVDLIINNKKFNPVECCLNLAFFEASGQIANQLYSLESLDVNYLMINDRKSYETTLMKAVTQNDLEKIELIFNHPSFDKIKSQFTKAVTISIDDNNGEIFKKLIECKFFDLNLQKIFDSALKNLSNQIIEIILNHPKFEVIKSSINKAFIQMLTKVCQSNDGADDELIFNIIDKLIEFDQKHEKEIDLNSNDIKDGKSVFTLKKNECNVKEYIDFFISRGVDPNQPDKRGVFPLEHAIQMENKIFVNLLICTAKIDFSVKMSEKKIVTENNDYDSIDSTAKNETYLHLASKCKNSEILEIFLKLEKIDINAIDDFGETPLMKACRYKRSSNICLLFENDDLDYLHCNNDGLDALKILKNYVVLNLNENPSNKNEYLNCLLKIIDADFDELSEEEILDNSDISKNPQHF